MASEELTISIGARDTGALSTIKQLNNQLKFLDREYALAQKSSKTFDSSLQGQRTKLEYLKNSYTVTAQKLDKYKQNMEKAKQTVEQKRQALEQLQDAEGDNAAAIERAQSSLNKAEDSYRRAQQSIVLTEAELRNFQTEIDETNRRIQNNALEQYQRRMQQIGTSVQNAGEKITVFGNGLSSVGNKLTALSAPFVAFSAYAVKTGMEFEEAIAKLGSTSGATASQMEQLKESSINLGEAIKGASATEVAESYNYLALNIA